MVKSELHQGQEPPIDEEGTQPYQMRYRWVMLALAWLAYAAFGLVGRAISPLITPMLEDLNISYTQMGIIMGSWPIAYIPVSIIGGAIIDRWGLRKPLFVGITIVALSSALRYFPDGFAGMFICVFLFGVGGPMMSIGGPKMISQWFRGKDRSLAIGVYFTGPLTGGTLALAGTNSVVMPLMGDSWRLTFVFYGLLVFAAALVWLLLARDVKTTEAGEKESSIFRTFTALARLRNVQLMLILGFLTFAIFHGFVDWLPKLLEDGGQSPEMAGVTASICYVAGAPALLLIPLLTPPRFRRQMVILLSFVDAIGMMLVVTTSGVGLWAGIVLFGMGKATILPLLLLILMDMPEVEPYMGAAGGMFFCVAEIGGFGGPFLLGALVDFTGTFLAGVATCAVMSLLCAVTVFYVKVKPASETQWGGLPLVH